MLITSYSVNEIFDPDRVNQFYLQGPRARADAIALDRGTNYGVVRPDLLDDIYSALFSYRLQYKCEHEWPQQILNRRTVTNSADIIVNNKPAIRLSLRNDKNFCTAQEQTPVETLDVDLVVVASGYRRNAHEELLQGLSYLKAEDGVPDSAWKVDRSYAVRFAKDKVSSNAGIWLQGCNESTHGLSDTLLSILAVRGGEVVNSIFGKH
jgi:L-ornithine N5-monooxygenase